MKTIGILILSGVDENFTVSMYIYVKIKMCIRKG